VTIVDAKSFFVNHNNYLASEVVILWYITNSLTVPRESGTTFVIYLLFFIQDILRFVNELKLKAMNLANK